MPSDTTSYRFGPFELKPDACELLAEGRPVSLGHRAFDLLVALVERRDRLVGKHELLDVVWPGLVVEENNLQVQVSQLRKLLGPQAIATVPGRGYRFKAVLEGAAAPAPFAAEAPTAPASRTNLPRDLPPLYGRDAERTQLCDLLLANKLVTVLGAGGIGKSRLAQACAHSLLERWPDGAWMVELAGLSDPALLPNTVAQALDVKLTGSSPAFQALVTALAGRTALIVLDNCEHLLDAVAGLVDSLLRGAPGVTMIATSQEPLHLTAEQQYRLTPLRLPASSSAGARECGSLALFEARVRAIDPRFALSDENLPLAIDVCRRLDGLPLAIELAAGRVATLGLRTVRDKLDARFKLLTGGARATLRRHQTLRAALEWSHNLLDDAERVVFRRLGVFAGGFTIELAQAVARDDDLDEWAVLDHLAALVDKSLVALDPGETPRYRLLESARAFALEQLAATATDDVVRRHALAMRAFVERVDSSNLDGEHRTDEYAAIMLPELDNLRAAHAWATTDGGEVEIAAAIAAHCGSLIDYAFECGDWLLASRPYVESGAAGAALSARHHRAIAAPNMSVRVPIAEQLAAARRAQALYGTLGHPRRVFSSALEVSKYLGQMDDPAGAASAFEEARALLRPDWPAEFRITLLRRENYLARRAGRFEDALALSHEMLRATAATKDWRLQVMAHINITDLLWLMGCLEEAARVARAFAAEVRVRPAADPEMDVYLSNVTGILSELGAADEALAVAREVWPIQLRTRVYYLEGYVHLLWRRGDGATAALLLGASDARLRSGRPRQPNEARLIAQARPALEAALGPEAFASKFAAGAALDEGAIAAIISEALAR